jgi:hypothetical protein
MCARTGGFWTPRIIYITLYRKNACYYITYSVPINPHKTHRRSPTLFSIYAFENSGCEQMEGPGDQHECLFIYSEFLYIHYLHIYQ